MTGFKSHFHVQAKGFPHRVGGVAVSSESEAHAELAKLAETMVSFGYEIDMCFGNKYTFFGGGQVFFARCYIGLCAPREHMR